MLEGRMDRLGEFLERTEGHPMTTPMMHTSPKAKVTTPTDREIRIERIFDAPRERVWRAMTDPAARRPVVGSRQQARHRAHGGGARRSLAVRRAQPRGRARLRGPLSRGHAAGARRADVRVGWHARPRRHRDTSRSRTSATAARRSSTCRCSTRPRSATACCSSGMEGGLNESYAALDRVLASM